MRVYLTGPISGVGSKNKIIAWRKKATEQLHDVATVIDPAYAKFDSSLYYEDAKKRANDGALSASEQTSLELIRHEHGHAVVDRNRLLVQSCDMVLANFSKAKTRASIGSIGELFWADMLRKPIIIVREDVGNVHDHAMLNSIAMKVCHSLDERHK